MLSDERLKRIAEGSTVSTGVAAHKHETVDMARELLTLRSENERLRGALTTIADMSCQCVCQEATGIAVDALTPPAKE